MSKMSNYALCCEELLVEIVDLFSSLNEVTSNYTVEEYQSILFKLPSSLTKLAQNVTLSDESTFYCKVGLEAQKPFVWVLSSNTMEHSYKYTNLPKEIEEDIKKVCLHFCRGWTIW